MPLSNDLVSRSDLERKSLRFLVPLFLEQEHDKRVAYIKATLITRLVTRHELPPPEL